MSDKDETSAFLKRDFYFLGKNLSEIPCFRNSMLYGISSGLAVGLGYFLFTSRAGKAANVGFGTYFGVTWIYWGVCRYNYNKVDKEIKQIQKVLNEKIDDATNDPVAISDVKNT